MSDHNEISPIFVVSFCFWYAGEGKKPANTEKMMPKLMQQTIIIEIEHIHWQNERKTSLNLQNISEKSAQFLSSFIFIFIQL